MRIIDADKYQKDLLSYYDDPTIELEVLDRQPLVSAIPITDKMTNGDMIKAIFPRVKYYMTCVEVKLEYHGKDDTGLLFDKTWWDSPYVLERED